MKTVYYAEGSHCAYDRKEDAEKAEKFIEEQRRQWSDNYARHDPKVKLDKLLFELNEAMIIPAGTICTCLYTSLQVKGMVRVCQKFAEENKDFLNYY